MSASRFNPLAIAREPIRLLHLTWFAFFLSFVIWFSHAPLKPLIMDSVNLTNDQWKALLILNVALTIPARILVGILVDKLGPRHVFSGLLILSGGLCLTFAAAKNFEQLALTRFLLGFVGAGFVIGIRLVGEWFPARQVGLAEGVYGGWGNFGSAAAAFVLPTLAVGLFGGVGGWRYAIACTGLLAMAYGLIFYWRARNTPRGATYFKPKRSGGLEVSSKKDFWLYVVMNLPMYLILGLLTWRLSPDNIGLLSHNASRLIYLILAILFAIQFSQIHRVNKNRLKVGVPKHDRYDFKQVMILNWAYFITFGSELAVVSMLPAFFLETFTGLSLAQAGMLGGAFAFMNLVARPGGGWISDKFGRRKSMTLFVGGLTVGYWVLSLIDPGWPLALAVIAVMCCSFFVQAGEGAVFAMVPLIKRRMTGQIAGMTGAYGNVGAVTYLTLYSFVDSSTFFMVIAASAAVGVLLVQQLAEPQGHTTEMMEDGTSQKIEVT